MYKSQFNRRLSLALLFPAFLLGICFNTSAQRRNGEERRQIHDAKVAIITNRLKLTPEQSAKFWPIYEEFSKERREIRRAQRQITGEKKTFGASNDVVMKDLKLVQNLRQQEIDVEQRYQEKFLEIISASQIVELYEAERTFNEMLLQRLKQKKRD